MNKICKYLLIVLIAIIISPEVSVAQEPDPPEDDTSDEIKYRDLCFKADGLLEDIGLPPLPPNYRIIRPNRISGNIVRCVTFVVNLAGYGIIFKYVLNFASFVFYFLLIAILFFAIRIMYGTARIQGITFLFIAKLIFILYVSNPLNIPHLIQWRDAFIEFPKDISLSILSHIESPVDKENNWITDPGDLKFGTDDVFDYFDRFFLHMLGVQQGVLRAHKTPEISLGIGLIVSGFLFTGPIGAALVLMMLMYVTAIIFAMGQAVIFFCTVVIAINFLVAISPLAAVCLMFNSTRRITQLWFNYILIYTIQPILLMAFLGIVLGIISSIINMPDIANPGGIIPGNFEKVFSSARKKWDNATGDDIQELTLLTCDDIKKSAANLASMMGNANASGNIWGSIYSQSRSNSAELNSFLSGGRFNDLANATFGAEDEECTIKVHGLKLDHNNPIIAGITNIEQMDSYLSKDMLQKFTGTQLAVIVIMVMLISFLREMPAYINRMVGQGVIPSIVQYASNPIKKAQDSIYGNPQTGQKGYLMQARDNVNSAFSERKN